MIRILIAFSFLFSAHAWAQASRFNITGVQGSVGAGFTEYTIESPKNDIKIDRGVYATVAGEKAFNFLNLYMSISLGYMDAAGTANYRYSNLSSSQNYSVNDVAFKSRMMELGLGLKMKLIDNYWFRPYVEGGGLGSWHEVTYTSKTNEMALQGPDYKTKDTIMGSGLYAEAGIEMQFSERFGAKLAGRLTDSETRDLDTLGKEKLKYQSQTFYMAALVGF